MPRFWSWPTGESAHVHPCIPAPPCKCAHCCLQQDKGYVGTAFCYADNKFESNSSSPRRGKRLIRPFMPWSCLGLWGLGGSLQEPKPAHGFPCLEQFLLSRRWMQHVAVVSQRSGKSFCRRNRRRVKKRMPRAPGKQLEDQELFSAKTLSQTWASGKNQWLQLQFKSDPVCSCLMCNLGASGDFTGKIRSCPRLNWLVNWTLPVAKDKVPSDQGLSVSSILLPLLFPLRRKKRWAG